MPTAPEPNADHTSEPLRVPAEDPAGRLLAALLATAGLADAATAEPAI